MDVSRKENTYIQWATAAWMVTPRHGRGQRSEWVDNKKGSEDQRHSISEPAILDELTQRPFCWLSATRKMFLIKWLLSAHQAKPSMMHGVSEMPCGTFTITEDHLHTHLLQVEYRQHLGGKCWRSCPINWTDKNKQTKLLKRRKFSVKSLLRVEANTPAGYKWPTNGYFSECCFHAWQLSAAS